MEKIFFALSLFLLSFTIGCKKNESYDQIIGKWSWVKSIFPYDQIVSTPQSAG
jgi:hypothetical protein